MVLLNLGNGEILYLVSFILIILLKIVCFVLGYLTIRLGYNLISSGAKGEFKFSSDFLGFKSDLASVSPGLLFVLLGILLIMVAIYVDKTVELRQIPETQQQAAPPAITMPFPPPGNPFDTPAKTDTLQQ